MFDACKTDVLETSTQEKNDKSHVEVFNNSVSLCFEIIIFLSSEQQAASAQVVLTGFGPEFLRIWKDKCNALQSRAWRVQPPKDVIRFFSKKVHVELLEEEADVIKEEALWAVNYGMFWNRLENLIRAVEKRTESKTKKLSAFQHDCQN